MSGSSQPRRSESIERWSITACPVCGRTARLGECHSTVPRQEHHATAVDVEVVVLAPSVAAVAATLVDLAKRSLPPHISEAQQVEAYLALRRIAGGQFDA